MSSNKITSAQVAKRAGVSQSAVSRVFTPGASASENTITKVKKAANDLGYRPNILARAMVSGKSHIIGVVVAYLENLGLCLIQKGCAISSFGAESAIGDFIAYCNKLPDSRSFPNDFRISSDICSRTRSKSL